MFPCPLLICGLGRRLQGFTLTDFVLVSPFNSQIKFVTLLTVNHTILIIIVQRI